MPARFSHVVALLLTCAVACIASTGCENGEDPRSQELVIARVGSDAILAADFERELEARALRAPGRFSEPDAREGLLRQMIALRVEVNAAREQGLHETPEFVRETERMLVRRLRAETLEAQLAAVTVEDAEVEDAYRADPARFTVPERDRAAIVEVAFSPRAAPEVRAAARARAEALLDEARALGPGYRGFGPIAAAHSDDRRSRYKGGDIGWFDRGQTETARIAPAVLVALSELDAPGEIGPIVETPEAFYLVMLLDRAPSALRPLAQVAPVLQAELQEAKRRDLESRWHAAIAARAEIEIDHAVLASVGPPADSPLATVAPAPPRPPALPQ